MRTPEERAAIIATKKREVIPEKYKDQDQSDDERLRRRLLADDPTALTPREQIFADQIVAGATQRAAYEAAHPAATSPKQKGLTDARARSMMRREKVIAYIARHAHGAAERVIELSRTAESESVRLDANQDILDRAGVMPPKEGISVIINIATILNKVEED